MEKLGGACDGIGYGEGSAEIREVGGDVRPVGGGGQIAGSLNDVGRPWNAPETEGDGAVAIFADGDDNRAHVRDIQKSVDGAEGIIDRAQGGH